MLSIGLTTNASSGSGSCTGSVITSNNHDHCYTKHDIQKEQIKWTAAQRKRKGQTFLTRVTDDHVNIQELTTSTSRSAAVRVSNVHTSGDNVSSGNVSSDNVSSGNVFSGTVSSGNVSSGNVSSGNVSSRNVSSGTVSSGNVSSGNVSSGNVSSRNVSSGTVSSGNVSSGNVSSGNVSSGNVSSGNVYSGNVSSGNVSSGTVSSGNVSSGNVSSGNVSCSNVSSGNVSNTRAHDEFQDGNNVLLLQLNDERSVAHGHVITFTSGKLHGRDVPVELTVVSIKEVWDKSCPLQYHTAFDEEDDVLIPGMITAWPTRLLQKL